MRTLIHAYIHTYIHIYIYIYIYKYKYNIPTYIHAYIHTYIHACMHACIHTHIHTYIHTFIHTYIQPFFQVLSALTVAVKQRGMAKFIVHDCVAKEVFSHGWTSGSGLMESWKDPLTNLKDSPQIDFRPAIYLLLG